MLETHRHLLIVNRPAIVKDLLVEDVLTELRSKFIIDQNDSELIQSERTSSRKAEELLDLLPNKGYGAFQAFYESLCDKYAHLAKLLESGVHADGNQSALKPGELSINNNFENESPMTEAHRNLLTSNRVSIVEDLLVDDVLPQLVGKFVFDDDDKQLIRSEKTAKRQTEKLLDLLVKKGDQAFGHFLSALKAPYPYLADLLQVDYDQGRSRFPSVANDQDEVVESKLLEGGVPKLPQVFTRRPVQRRKLRTALHSLCENRDTWVILHGMAGCGKTILAADALRSVSLLKEAFPGGVVWIHIGPVDRPKLLMKMQNLCRRLDEDKLIPVPRNLEEAQDRLRSIFKHQYPLTLLVLDDLWSAHDARYFDIRARILVTTRDVSIANSIEVPKCRVHVAEKLSPQQCKDILCQWTGKHVTELPNEADDIIKECHGHPLTISMIGALLKDHPQRWFYYYTQLHNHKISKLKLESPYPYPSLAEAIAMSIDNLSKELKDKFQDFVIFDSSIKVPVSILCLLWELDKEEVEDTMDKLINKSLVKSTQSSDCLHGESGYAIHNLQLNYLLETCADIEARHTQLVNCYRKSCKGDFSSLVDDGYVHWNLIHHMLEAKQESKAIQLLTNLAWVTRKLEVSGPADVINDYINVYKHVQEEEKDELKNLNDFYQFVRTHAHMFASRPMPDVVQTALSEPSNNDVYKQGKKEALKRSKQKQGEKTARLYFDWCNKKSESAQSLEMTVKPHNGTVHCCVFSSDGKTILSSSSDGTAKVWEAMSGKELHSLEEHTDVVNCCAFNYDNTKVLTVSHDGTVKVWKLGSPHEVKLTYKDHTQDIYCAAFSPTASAKEVISCSADSTIRVWDCESGSTSVVCIGHTDVVRWCCFSPDGLRIASGSHDQTVKVWDVATGQCLMTTAKHEAFVSYCCFSRDGKMVYSSSAMSIRLWDSVSGEPCGSIDIDASVLAFALSPVEDKIAVALSDATVQLWDTNTRQQLNVYHGHKSWVLTVHFSSDGTQLVSGSADETIKVWPVDTTAFTKRVRLRKVFDVVFKDGQPLIAIADSQDILKIFEGVEKNELCQTKPYSAKVTSCIFSMEGKRIAVGLQSGEIELLDAKTCQPLQTFPGHYRIDGKDAKVYSLSWSNSGSVLLSCSRDQTFMTWDCKSGKALLGKSQRHDLDVTVALFFDDDKRIVTASKDGTAKVWDSSSGKLCFTCDHGHEWVLTCVVSPDDSRIVTGCTNKHVKIWDAVTGRKLFEMSPHGDVIRSLAIDEDSSIFASGSDDGTVKISRLLEGNVLSSCTSHTGAWVTDIVFGKNGEQLVTVGNNIQWHSRNGHLLQQFFIKGSHLRRIKCSSNFQMFVTVDDIGVLYILKVIV